MPLVAAKCISCGANIQVDNAKEAAICPFCDTPYIVEKAINNYKVNVQGNVVIENAIVMNSNSENLAKRGEEFEKSGNKTKAVEYYNKALDVDINCTLARDGLERIKRIETDALIAQLLDKAAKEEKQNINEALRIYNQILSIDSGSLSAKERLNALTTAINNYSFYAGKAKTFRDSGEMILSVSTLSFISKKGYRHDYPVDLISSILATENVRFSGESFGRTKPNVIRFLIRDHGNETKYDFKVHHATELARIVRALQEKDFQKAMSISKGIQ